MFSPISPKVLTLSQVFKFSSVIPNWSYILTAVAFIIGFINVATILIDSHKLYKTVSNSPFLASSLAKAQGIVSSIYLLVLLINFQADSKASLNWSLFISISKFSTDNLAVSFKLSSNAVATFAIGIIPSLYFSTIETVLLTKFPKSLARSELSLVTKFLWV